MTILSFIQSISLSIIYSIIYLSSIYLHSSTRIKSISSSKQQRKKKDDVEEEEKVITITRDRNDPSIIKARLIAVSLATSLSILSIPLILNYYKILSSSTTILTTTTNNLPTFLTPSLLENTSYVSLSLVLLGLIPPPSPSSPSLKPISEFLKTTTIQTKTKTTILQTLLSQILLPTFYASLLTISLFTGSIYLFHLAYVPSSIRRDLKKGRNLIWDWHWNWNWEGIRNYVLGPITEELLFRSVLVTISKLSNFSNKSIILFCPLYFGLAHIHHAREAYISGGRTFASLKFGILRSLFQLTYTSLFGSYATYLFLRTGSIYPPIVAHSLCNWFGFPMITWGLSTYPSKKYQIIGTYLIGIIIFSVGLTRFMNFGILLIGFGVSLEEGRSIYWSRVD